MNRSVLLLALLVGACAQVREPTGGDKDITPPQLLRAEPPNGSTHFATDRILLQFDERIRTEKVRDRLLISPPLASLPDLRVLAGRSVQIVLKEELKPNTTYTFGIGETILDLTEGNAATGLVYVVSTGTALDSLQVMGTVIDARTAEPAEEVLVLLHDVTDTTDVRTSRPAYAIRSDAQGNYRLRHLKEGTYRLYALNDNNNNYRFDLPNEEIAFLMDEVVLGPADTAFQAPPLRMFMQQSAKQKVVDRRVLADGAFRVVFSRPAGEIHVRDVLRTGGNLQWDQEWNKGRDTLLLWPSDTTALRLGGYALREDTLVLDTLKYRPTERMPFHVDLRPMRLRDDPALPPLLRASRPLASVTQGKATLMQDSTEVPVRLLTDTLGSRILQVVVDTGTILGTLTILPKAMKDIYGGQNDTLRLRLGAGGRAEFGMLRLRWPADTVERPSGPFILHLLVGNRMEREILVESLEGAVLVEFLPTGAYTLQLIEDGNGNGRWDPGDLDAGRQPEAVWRYPEPVNIRANWDLGVDWALEEQ